MKKYHIHGTVNIDISLDIEAEDQNSAFAETKRRLLALGKYINKLELMVTEVVEMEFNTTDK